MEVGAVMELNPKYGPNVQWVYIRDHTSTQAKPAYRVDTLNHKDARSVWIVDDEHMNSTLTQWIYWSTPSNPDATPVYVVGSDSTSEDTGIFRYVR